MPQVLVTTKSYEAQPQSCRKWQPGYILEMMGFITKEQFFSKKSDQIFVTIHVGVVYLHATLNYTIPSFFRERNSYSNAKANAGNERGRNYHA